jgi:hypothetical protein
MPCANQDSWATFQSEYKLPEVKKKFPCMMKKNVWSFSSDGELRQVQWRRIRKGVLMPSDNLVYPALSPAPPK